MLTDYFDGFDLLAVIAGYVIASAIRRDGSCRLFLRVVAATLLIVALISIPRAVVRCLRGLALAVCVFYDTAPRPFEPFINSVFDEVGYDPEGDSTDGPTDRTA